MLDYRGHTNITRDMLLNDFITGACWNVVAVGPDRRPRIIRKQRPEEFVAIIGTEWVRTRADRITHRVGTLRTGLSALVSRRGLPWLRSLILLSSLASRGLLSCWPRRRGQNRRRHK